MDQRAVPFENRLLHCAAICCDVNEVPCFLTRRAVSLPSHIPWQTWLLRHG